MLSLVSGMEISCRKWLSQELFNNKIDICTIHNFFLSSGVLVDYLDTNSADLHPNIWYSFILEHQILYHVKAVHNSLSTGTTPR
jgi:hypothetical protein